MSIEKSYYVIAGYDLTGYETDKYEEWKYSSEWEDYIENKVEGEIQLFDDFACENRLYLGYVLARGDEYSFGTKRIDLTDVGQK